MSKQIVVGIFAALLFLTMPANAVETFKVSNYGAGIQIWFEAEDFDERNPADDQNFPVVNEAGAFGQAVSRAGSGGMIRWTFDISKARGKGGIWYFWVRTINPGNTSDYMLVEGDPGDAQIPNSPPFPSGDGTAPFDNADDRILEETLGPPWAWGLSDHAEGHTKQLRDGENTMYVFDRQGDSTVFWDVFLWTDDPDYVPTDAHYENATVPIFGAASNPSPADEATDVSRDVVLNWKPGEYAPAVNGHRVFLGEIFSEVNDGIGGITHSAGSYAPPQRLDFGTTYYWRVDEVNAPPDSTVFEGEVWSFTTEPVGYPIDGANITTTASSVAPGGFGPENTINRSGLNANDGHSTDPLDMWMSDSLGPQPTWIEYQFDRVYSLHEMWVWNSNQAFESFLGFGLRDVTVEYSTDGAEWATLAGAPEFAQAPVPATSYYAHNTTVDFAGAPAKHVRLTVNSNWASVLPQSSLSEVRFFQIPVSATTPSPDSGATGVAVDVVLGWRAGRGAVTHNVSFSADEQAVIDGTAPVAAAASGSYSPADLDLNTSYYWKVGEVNEAETPSTWESDVWSFTTSDHIVVDDFEAYNDIDPPDADSNRIFESWPDGFGNTANGALVGNDPPQPSYAETVIVRNGKQSMPMFYSNTLGATSSEATRTFAVPQDWTAHGVKTLGLYFFGTLGNTGQLYVKINGSKIPYDREAGNIAISAWQPWNIDLTSSGLNLQSVGSLTIGVEGSGTGGTLYFDDIRLHPYDRQFITPIAPDNAGLIGHWTFDGNMQDSSGLGNHGTGGGDPTFAAGHTGQAIDLDGSDYVVIDGVADDITTNNFTVSAWIKTTQTDDGDVVASNNDASDHDFIIGVVNGNVLVEADSISEYPPTVNDNQWHLLTYTREGNTANIYVNGFMVGTEQATGDPAAHTRWSIGQEWDTLTPSDFYTGMVDDVRFYNYPLSEAEVAGLAGRTAPFEKPF